MIATGLIGNTLSFLIMSLPSNRKNVMCFYLRVLAICDVLAINFFLLPRWVFSMWPEYLRVKSIGALECILAYWPPFVFCDASIWLIPFIALDRFIVVRFPLRASQWCTMKRAKILCTFDITLHLFLYLPNAFRQTAQDENGLYTVCNLPPAIAWYEMVFQFSNAIFDVVVPMILIFGFNIAIIYTLRKHSADLKDQTGAEGSKQRVKQERSLTIMLVVVATSLMILCLPYMIDFVVWQWFLGDLLITQPSIKPIKMLTYEIRLEMVQWNNALNFFMYFASSSKFRKDLRVLFCDKLGKFSSLNSSSSGPKSTQVSSSSQCKA
jgi:hypothetical protein